MSWTHKVVVGGQGRVVVPAEVRERAGIVAGTELLLLETPTGLVLLTQEQLRARVRADLAGADLVGELLAERRANAAGGGPRVSAPGRRRCQVRSKVVTSW